MIRDEKRYEMMRVHTRVFALLLCISLLPLSLSSCKKQLPKKDLVHYNSEAYASVSFEIPVKEGFEIGNYSVMPDGEENSCVVILYTEYNEKREIRNQITDIYTVDEKGNLKYTLEILGNQVPCAVLENEYVFLGYRNADLTDPAIEKNNEHRTVVFLDKKTGEQTRTVETDFEPYYVVPISDGFVIGGLSSLSRYKPDGTLVSKLNTGFGCYRDAPGFFEQDGRFFVIEEVDMGEYAYHEVDFSTGKCTLIAASEDIGIDGVNLSGSFIFHPDGEYRVDLTKMQVQCLADRNAIDIQPPRSSLYFVSKYFSLDEERFALGYIYADGTAQILFFRYDPSIDLASKEIIRIGGYGVFQDELLSWMVYEFNVESKKYRIILEDYSTRFTGDSFEEQRKGKLKLMQYFQEGNAPDIFYGAAFDYNYMGRNDMVIDLSAYLAGLSDTEGILTDTAHRLLINEDNTCFSMFAGYRMDGYFMLQSDLDQVADTSFSSLYQYAREKDTVFSDNWPARVMVEALQYRIEDLWGVYDGKRKITHEELLELVKEILTLPEEVRTIADEEDVIYGKFLKFPMFFGDFYDEAIRYDTYREDFTFIGYPSLQGLIYPAIPDCSLAISSTAANQDVCWEVLKQLLSPVVQKKVLSQGEIPVTKEGREILVDTVSHPDQVTDPFLKSWVGKNAPADQDILLKYLSTCDKADSIVVSDVGVTEIIYDEIESYYVQNRTPEQVADSLDKRITLYIQENY